jgi:protein involved in sex pheromone biosynthesis
MKQTLPILVISIALVVASFALAQDTSEEKTIQQDPASNVTRRVSSTTNSGRAGANRIIPGRARDTRGQASRVIEGRPRDVNDTPSNVVERAVN